MDKSTVKTLLKYCFYLVISLEAFTVCVLGIGTVIICKAGNEGIMEFKEWVSVYRCFTIAICICIGIGIGIAVLLGTALGKIIYCLCKHCKKNAKYDVIVQKQSDGQSEEYEVTVNERQ